MIKLIAFFTIIPLFLGCSNQLQLPDSKSGFLSSYDLFKPNPRMDNSWVRAEENVSLKTLQNYKKIAIAPIELWLESNKPSYIKDENKQKALNAYFEQLLKEKIGDEYQIVPPGTKNSLLIRLALTNLEESSPEFEVLDVLPFRIVINAGEGAYRLATNQKAVIGEAGFEAEFVDTNSNDTLIAIIMNSKSDEMNVDDNPNNIDSIKVIINGWVEQLAITLNEENLN
ncbi:MULTISPECIES: DUF3313 domain-containing protein [unclassified Colwellia]|uniref:DUF3313 domain-containing protein n=1 Tax=unclassified Colwellia TaxID=196834 RepID=UPI0015F57FED|nr:MULTISPECIES: DUF3313 domain-containing protein [unclassified Colwellia]MBA6232285.1 DUF3313 domain-containing protein [Colwellia sp. MB02u-7]MBA6237723.1 DUF3313 domain-containing protein [Colwellia sp. MB02u-11]MBA6257814.1 DUF3313 domain-containing protein [Colwellia sp. MB3u-28]MBA6260871.1 DUF3313 domain-containing protein [Colwellia sp. MB3u-41]MBA6300861.1 DUF3313 domain-containing protein [Colwellia sp. MB3u-22]